MQTVTINKIYTHIERGVITVHKAHGYFMQDGRPYYFAIEHRQIMDNTRNKIELSEECRALWDNLTVDRRNYIFNRMLVEMRRKLFNIMD